MSTLQVNTVKSNTTSVAPVFQDSSGSEIGTLCRAWVSFRGIGTVSIDGAFNVSSITDLGVGVYRVNFTNAMPNLNHAIIGSCSTDAVTFNGWVTTSAYNTTKSTTSTELLTLAAATSANAARAAGQLYDPLSVYVAIFN